MIQFLAAKWQKQVYQKIVFLETVLIHTHINCSMEYVSVQ